MTVAEATEQNQRLVAHITSEQFWPSGYHQVVRIGCRINPDTLLGEGPPWQVRTIWSVTAPPEQFVQAALERLDTLAAEGFRRQPWTRPDPEPPDNRAYRDDRGYLVWARTETTVAGDPVFEVTVTSPQTDD